MKKIMILILLAALGTSCSEKVDEIIDGKYHYVLEIDELKALSYYQGGLLPAVQSAGDYLPSQLDDLDENGTYDVFSFISESDQFEIVFVNRINYPVFDQATNVRFAIKEGNSFKAQKRGERVQGEKASNYQMEGPAWENDLLGFRNYFDERNGMDIFGKTTNNMVLDTIGIRSSYHEKQDWGMDILKVGNSLGAGSIALLKNDSLYRIGPGATGTYKLLASGPVRSVFELSFENIEIDGNNYSIKQEITIWKGDFRYESKVWLEGGDGTENLVTGIVNRDLKENDTLYTTSYEGYVSLMTHDRQASDGAHLSLGVLIPEDDFLFSGRTPDSGEGITQSYYAVLNNEHYPLTYYFYAGWEETDTRFADINYMLDIIEADIELKH